jgi:hypothetical protein
MTQVLDMAALVSFQETAKVLPRKQTLHEQMCFIADDVVRYNFSDVAVHEKRILARMHEGETRLWIIHEFGSQFLPLYCKTGEWQRQGKNGRYLCSVEVTIARLLRNDELQQVQNKIIFDSAQYFIVTKGRDIRSGTITPVSFSDVVHLVFCGKADHLVSGN